MNNSTEGVTLYAGFIFALLSCYERSRTTFAEGLFEMAEGLDPDQPTALAPMQLYNDMCLWIEENLGAANLRRAGAAIGDKAYGQMLEDGGVGSNPSPLDMLTELKRVASVMIQDPLDRQWELLEVQDDFIVFRRTQTFNCILQEGLLHSLVKRTGETIVDVDHVSCTRRGDDFCDYRITWWST